jgi:tetratricopeptide (TPR) repeat protein
VIMRKYSNKMVIILALLALAALTAGPAVRGAQQSQQPTYTMPEYNGFQNCQAQKDPQSKVKCLDGFVAQFPKSTLMQYVDQVYYRAYYELKNYPKTIEYADKLAALGDKANLGLRLQAVQARIQLFPFAFDAKAADAQTQLTKERDAAQQGVKLLDRYKSTPQSKLTDAQYKAGMALFYAASGFASYQLKDNSAAVESFKAALANNPNDAVSQYRLGLAYLALTPPQSLDGFWVLARAIQLKVPDAGKVKDYLRGRILAYEQPACESLVDAQLSELLQLAAGTQDRPASYSIPSATDLRNIAQASTIVTLLNDLQAGGDKARMTWLALCGAEFPEVVGKIINVNTADHVVIFHVFTSADQTQMQNATTANMEVKVSGQPDAARLAKDDPIKFSGTVTSYDPQPFMLHWDKAKVDPSIIPKKTRPGKRPARKPPARRPGH